MTLFSCIHTYRIYNGRTLQSRHLKMNRRRLLDEYIVEWALCGTIQLKCLFLRSELCSCVYMFECSSKSFVASATWVMLWDHTSIHKWFTLNTKHLHFGLKYFCKRIWSHKCTSEAEINKLSRPIFDSSMHCVVHALKMNASCICDRRSTANVAIENRPKFSKSISNK